MVKGLAHLSCRTSDRILTIVIVLQHRKSKNDPGTDDKFTSAAHCTHPTRVADKYLQHVLGQF